MNSKMPPQTLRAALRAGDPYRLDAPAQPALDSDVLRRKASDALAAAALPVERLDVSPAGAPVGQATRRPRWLVPVGVAMALTVTGAGVAVFKYVPLPGQGQTWAVYSPPLAPGGNGAVLSGVPELRELGLQVWVPPAKPGEYVAFTQIVGSKVTVRGESRPEVRAMTDLRPRLGSTQVARSDTPQTGATTESIRYYLSGVPANWVASESLLTAEATYTPKWLYRDLHPGKASSAEQSTNADELDKLGNRPTDFGTRYSLTLGSKKPNAYQYLVHYLEQDLTPTQRLRGIETLATLPGAEIAASRRPDLGSIQITARGRSDATIYITREGFVRGMVENYRDGTTVWNAYSVRYSLDASDPAIRAIEAHAAAGKCEPETGLTADSGFSRLNCSWPGGVFNGSAK